MMAPSRTGLESSLLVIKQRTLLRSHLHTRKKYNNSPELQDRLDNRVEQIRESFETQDWKGVTDGPDEKRYIDVTGSVRLVVSVDEDEQSIELLDFGDRMKIPPKHGLHKSRN